MIIISQFKTRSSVSMRMKKVRIEKNYEEWERDRKPEWSGRARIKTATTTTHITIIHFTVPVGKL